MGSRNEDRHSLYRSPVTHTLDTVSAWSAPFARIAVGFMEVIHMVIRDKEYYDQFGEIMVKTRKEVDYYTRQAERYRQIYFATKGRSGVYAILNKLAERLNRFYCGRGEKIAKENLKWCILELKYLHDYISQNEP